MSACDKASAQNHSESKINSLITDYLKNMKEEVIRKLSDVNIDSNQEIINFIQEYPNLVLSEKDYLKRKRVKTNVPLYEKCLAKRANGEQCSRRKKDGSDFCGTHSKGCPHGVVNVPGGASVTGEFDSHSNNGLGTTKDGLVKKQIQVWLEDINGIMYWINETGSVYDTSDIMNNVENPRVIAKYEKNMENDKEVYKIIGEVH